MRLLVTGGAGFIGSNLVHTLLPKSKVERLIVLDSLTYAGNLLNLKGAEKYEKYSFVKADIRNFSSILDIIKKESISHLIHLAAESHVDKSISGPKDFVETNIVGTFNLLEACRQFWNNELANCRFLHVSTDEVFGSLKEKGKFDENSPYQPNSPYCATKAGSDHLVRSYHQTYGLPVVITNCSNNFGPYQYPEKLIPKTIQLCVTKDYIPIYGDGGNIRDWLYVLDHATALWSVLIKNRPSISYNIGGDNEFSNLKIVEKICDIIDKKLKRKDGTGRELIKFVKDRPGHDFRYAVDGNKVYQEIGWKPFYEINSAIEKTIDWYVTNTEWLKSIKG